MKSFTAPNVQSARDCRFNEGLGGRAPNIAGWFFGLETGPCVAQRAPGD